MPFVVPYDFDHSGFVNAGYATPNELLGTETVKERVYRGFPRPIEEINTALNIFKQKKAEIYSLISNFELLSSNSRKEIIKYFDEFYKIADNLRDVQRHFIEDARKN